MEHHVLIDLVRRLLWLVLSVSLPVVAAAVAAGLLAGLAQAVTQIQDPSIGFAARLLACVMALVLYGPWAGAEIYTFGQTLLDTISAPRR